MTQDWKLLKLIGIRPDRVIIKLTEGRPNYDCKLLRKEVMHHLDMEFQIAIDDIGKGFFSWQLWTKLRPEYIKIDMHFTQGINLYPVELQFVRSIQEDVQKLAAAAIAGGIETQSEVR